MMAASRDLPFSLVIVFLVLIRGYTPLPTNPMSHLRSLGFETEALLFPSDDYNILEDITITPISQNTVRPVEGPFRQCDYDPCRENQISCAILSSSGCSCPGFTLHNERPSVPTLTSVSWNGSEVVIRWCAPYSYVTEYVVTIGGEEKRKFGKDQRSGGVGDIDHISEVCVFAVNDFGRGSHCMMYQPRDNSLPLKAGLIGGALGLLLLVLLAVLLWRHKRQRKQQASISMRDTAAGTQ